jgi:hypothetical protein
MFFHRNYCRENAQTPLVWFCFRNEEGTNTSSLQCFKFVKNMGKICHILVENFKESEMHPAAGDTLDANG